jgi:DNA-binding SARP family transcriptional activator
MARLDVRLMGAPEVEISGKMLVLHHAKARALLFYLAATALAHSRDHLATLLWGESGQSDALHSLRSSLYYLRQALRSNEIFEINEESLRLRPEMFACDVEQFRRLLAAGDADSLGRAASLYRGPFLQGFTLPDAPAFEEWLRLEDTRLARECIAALDRLATLAEGQGEWSAAAGYIQQAIQLDPLDEETARRLIRLYLRQGQIGPALRQFRMLENQLQQELGLHPAPETYDLLGEILGQQVIIPHQQGDILRQGREPASPGTFSAGAPDVGPRPLPFTGRGDLLDQLWAVSRETQAGRGATILLQGEGGIGKSRLIGELAAQLIGSAHPWLVLQGVCSPFDNALSHGPFLDALQYGIASDQANLLVEADTGEPDARGRFSWRVLQTIRSLAHTAPLLLVIEDLQWANSATLNLFGFLSTRIHHLPVLLIGTVQQAEGIPALQRLIALERRKKELVLFSLAPLGLQDVSEILEGVGIDSASVESLAEWLHARSAGNPYLLSEILAQLRADSILQAAPDGWQADTARWLRWRSTFTLPETTYDLVAWRLAALSPEARGILNVLAVAGQPLPAAVLGRLSGLGAGDLADLVDDLAERGLVVEAPNAHLALSHHLLREALLHRLSDLRRRSIHQELAEALETHASPSSDVRAIALHAVAGEDVERARRYGLRVLAELPKEYVGAETVDFVHHLYELLAPTASNDEMIRLTRTLGTLHQALGQLKPARSWHEQNLRWAKEAGYLNAQAEAHFEMAELDLMSNDYRAAVQSAQDGLALLFQVDSAGTSLQTGLPSLSGRGHRLLGAALAMEGSDLASAEEHLRQAVTAHKQTGNRGDLCAAMFELGNVAAQRGELQQALDLYDEAARTAETERIHYYRALALNNFAYHSLLLGRVEAAQRAVNQGIKIAEAFDMLAALLHLLSTRGEIHLSRSEWLEAEESFRSGLAIAEELGSLERQAGYRGGLALAARGRKDFDSARRLLLEGLALIAEGGYWHLRTRLQLWLAETLFEQGQYTEAGMILEEALAVARAQQRTLLIEEGERLHTQLMALREK